MELKPGYKQTEVGVIPEEWDVKRLGKIGKVVRGGSPRPAGDPKFFDGDFIPWLTVAALTNIPDHQLEVRHTETRLTEEGSKRSRTLQPETVIIANSGATLGIAKVSIIECCANDGVAAIIDQHVGEKAFVCHCINAQTQRLREVVATGNGQPNLNTGLIKEIAIPWPPQTEQAAIAECILDLDKLLRCLEDAVVKKQRLKQAAMQELLTGKRRLPGFEGEWKEASIGGIIDLLTGFPFPSSGYRSSGVRLLRGSNVKRGLIDWNEDLAQHWPAITSDIAHYELRERDIVIAMDGALVGRSYARVQASDLPALLLQRVARIRSSSLCNDFLFFQIGSSRFADHCDSVKTSTAIPHISPSDIRNFTTLIPPTKKEQKAIAAILLDLDAELSGLKARLDKARELKQGMMQQLLTGKIRLR